MPIRKLKPIDERDPQAALVLDAFDRLTKGEPMYSDRGGRNATQAPIFKCDDFAYSLTAMLSANQDDPYICAWLDQARKGDQITVGGGAAPFITIKRVQ